MQKLIIALTVLISFSSYAVELGNDPLAGKISLIVSDQPSLYSMEVVAEKLSSAGVTDPLERVAAFQTCYKKKLVPKLLDSNFVRSGSGSSYKRYFKCVSGDNVDWKRAVRMFCTPKEANSEAPVLNYCKLIADDKSGETFKPCKGKCESVQDISILR